jgi:hypothetical protein
MRGLTWQAGKMRVRGTLTLVAELMDGGTSDDARAKETREKNPLRKIKQKQNRCETSENSCAQFNIPSRIFLSMSLGPHGNAVYSLAKTQ